MFKTENRFNDSDQCAESLMKWNMELQQISRGKFSGKIIHVIFENMIIQRFDINRSFKFLGQGPLDFYSFSIGVRIGNKATWRSREFASNKLGIYPFNSELEGVTPEDFITYELSFRKPFLTRLAKLFGIDDFERWLGGDKLLKIHESIFSKFKRKLSLVNNGLTEVNTFSRMKYSSLEEELGMDLLALISKQRESNNKVYTEKVSNAVKSFEEQIYDGTAKRIGLMEICDKINISLRSLEYAINKQYDMTPIQYMRTLRLNQVRKNLLKTNAEFKVISNIAGKFGFSHMGQFAKDYKNLFGELPSETISRTSILV